MTEVETSLCTGEPTDEEAAAVAVAVHLALRRRRPQAGSGSRWMRVGRAESVAAEGASCIRPAGWTTIERPR
jgi:hypothetical protein